MGAWIKRTILFLALNFIVIMTLSVLTSVLGIRPYIQAYGMNYQSLAFYCLIWGMGGSLISLSLSRFMAKMTMGVRVIEYSPLQNSEGALVGRNRPSACSLCRHHNNA